MMVFLTVICSPPFAIYYGIQMLFASSPPTAEQQFAKSLSTRCAAEWKVLAEQTFKRHGIWAGGDAPDYCYDHARNLKVYGYTR